MDVGQKSSVGSGLVSEDESEPAPHQQGSFALQPVQPCYARVRAQLGEVGSSPQHKLNSHNLRERDIREKMDRESYFLLTHGRLNPCKCLTRAVCSTLFQRQREEITAARAAWESPSWLESREVIAFVNRILLLLTILGWSQTGLDSLCLNNDLL